MPSSTGLGMCDWLHFWPCDAAIPLRGHHGVSERGGASCGGTGGGIEDRSLAARDAILVRVSLDARYRAEN